MTRLLARRRPYQYHQQGQAMVEYAILFILLSILFIGGAELGMGALASYKNTDAAKTAISEYVEVNQQRLNILNSERQYLSNLSSYDNCTEINDAGVCDSAGTNNNFIKFLDTVYIGNSVNFNSLDAVASYLNASADSTAEEGSPSKVIEDLSTAEDFFNAESDISNTTASTASEGQLKYKALLLIAHFKLSLLPLLTDINNDNVDDIALSQARIAIGDHASNMQSPACLPGNDYDYGFPVDGVNDRYIAKTGEGYKVFLFNPLPIDVASCKGSDDSRGGRSRLSILVGGYDNPNDTIKYEPGLPKLNQAMYGMYKSNLNGLLIPPGKMCVEAECPNQSLIGGNLGPTGYYRWNMGSDGSGEADLFQYTISNVENDLLNGFRPAMQLDCQTAPNPQSDSINDNACQDMHTKVRIHTRYRKLFEGFLTFGLQELNVAEGEMENALQLFYNPNNVGVTGSHQVNGTIDSEIGPLGSTGKPTVKRHKDFRGCYEVDVQTNQITACN